MRVMVIGASSDPDKFGNKAVRAYLRQGGHEVFPVNPKETEIEGLRCYADVSAVPGPIDRASMYLPAAVSLKVLDALAARGDVAELWLNPGADAAEVVERAQAVGFDPIQACSIVAIGMEP